MKLRSLSVLALPLVAASLDYDPITQFCRRFYHQTAVLGTRLYVDGGHITTGSTGANTNITNTRLLFHDLSDDTTRAAPLIANLSKPAEAPSVVGGALWADQANERLFLFGGEYADAPPPANDGVWSYDPWVDRWERVVVSGAEFARPSFGAGATVEHMGVAYYYGGWLGRNNVAGWQGPRVALNTMIVYDMVENVFRNVSGPPNRDPRVEGVMVYVPVGDQGLLVMFGGMYARNGREKELYPAPMGDIDIFDVGQGKWYREYATPAGGLADGQLPESRRRSCGGMVSAEDGSSHNVYIYGGASTSPAGMGSDDVWILTMPGFRWVKYFDQGTPRAIHNGFSCDIVGNSQMIVLGGTFPHDTKQCDAEKAQGTHYLDLGRANKDNQEWYGYRKNLTYYTVPGDLATVIGGGPEGRATVVTPEHGFNNTDMATLFSRKIDIVPRQPTRTPTPLSDKSNPNTGSAKESNTSKPSLALILGPSVGAGVPALCLFIGLIVFCRRRRGNQHDMKPKEIIRSPSSKNKLLDEIAIPRNVYDTSVTRRSPNTAGNFPPVYSSNYAGHYGYDKLYKETQPLPSIPAMPNYPPPRRPGPAVELPTADVPHELPAAPLPTRSASAGAGTGTGVKHNYYHHTGHQQRTESNLWRSPSEPWGLGSKNKNTPPPGMI